VDPRLLERLLPGWRVPAWNWWSSRCRRAGRAARRPAGRLPLAADESCTDRSSLDALAGRYQYINIKLDKCGGLTEALALADAAQQRARLGLMVGNMCGTSLAMAPAFLLAQRCRYVDLDGPLLQRLDREHPMRCEHGVLQPPAPALWG
jgi:L-alanine-DL-glutamate epimerase-like enolase superfamily enzyme